MQSKQLILLGPPGAGVSAQAIALADQWQVPYVSMPGLMRQAIVKASAVGTEIQAYRAQAAPIPDELLIKLLRQRFEQPDVMLNGWVLDGFPSTLAQAKALDELLLSFGLPEAAAAYIKASTGILINRLAAEDGVSESVSVLRSQITDYKEQIVPVMSYYQQKEAKGAAAPSRLTVINGSQSVAEVTNALVRLEHEETGAARFIDEAELDVLIKQESLLVVDCVASWCGPCKQVSPLIDRLAEAYSDRASVVKLDFDNNRQVAKRFELKGMPSVMFFKDGELRETLTGMKLYQQYDDAIARLT
ncbi:MAG: nucleoside monophosphate kinase [Phormidesmis sp.]